MMKKYLLGSIAALLGWSGLAQAQVALGTPVTSENHLEARYSAYAPTTVSSNCRWDCKPKASHPVLSHIARTMLMPIRAATGHLMPPASSELPTKETIARMIVDGGYSPAEITAAKIKIDESQATLRRAAVRYLGTVDCNYYPEAEAGLIAALRADRVEMVRYEAALALGNCRGLTEKMLEALNMTALGVELDGNPAESSEQVREAAHNALHRCAHRGLCFPPEPPPLTPTIDLLGPAAGTVQPTAYSLAVQPRISPEERTLAESVSATPRSAPAVLASRSLVQFFANARSERTAARSSRHLVDPRLQGLSPIGTDLMLAIPTTPPIPDTIAPTSPYNYPQ